MLSENFGKLKNEILNVITISTFKYFNLRGMVGG